mgnify:CR=1 FL=1
MISIVLVEPEIPENTGNISRTCAVTGSVISLASIVEGIQAGSFKPDRWL